MNKLVLLLFCFLLGNDSGDVMHTHTHTHTHTLCMKGIQLPTEHLLADLALKKQKKDEQSRKQKEVMNKKQGVASAASIEVKLAELKELHQSVADNKSGSKRAMRSAGTHRDNHAH